MNAPRPPAAITALPETHFAIPGMRCAGCISKLETGLPQVGGIVAARVNFTSKRIAISHLPETTIPDIQRAIAALGFESQPLGDEITALSDNSSRDLLKAMAVAGFAMMNICLLYTSPSPRDS